MPLASQAGDMCADVFGPRARELGEAFYDADVEQQIQAFLQSEDAIVGRESAASRVRIHRDEQGRILRRPVVVLFHGLLNTPAFFQRLENETFDRGSHVINMRLPGHFEQNPRALDFINRADWIRRAEQVTILASRLRSNGVTIVGHSVGGLLASKMAELFPFYVKKLVLIAPAFGLSWQTKLLIHATAPLGLSGWLLAKPVEGSRYQSTFAGIQTEKIIGENANAVLFARLQKIPVLWFDTASDTVIDVQKNVRVAAALNIPHHVLLPKADEISHNDLGQFNTHAHDDLLTDILDFVE